MTFRMDPTPSDHTGGFLAGDTRVAVGGGISLSVADAVERQHRGGDVRVDALEADGTVRHVRLTSARRLEGDAEVVAVWLDDGAVVHCSPGQLLLGPAGEWRVARELRHGDALFTVPGTSGRTVDRVEPHPHRALYEVRVEHLHNVVHPSGVVLHD